MFSRIKRSLLGLTLVFLASCSRSESLLSEIEAENSPTVTNANPTQVVDYDSYAELLSQYVNEEGLVDYLKLQSNRQSLDEFNRSVASVSPAAFLGWSEREQIAFLMNAYNSYTLAAIIDREPLPNSIRDIPQVWTKKQYQVVGQNESLDDIEHGTLRKDYDEPRLHAALVCAAISCPPLLDEPYRGEDLDEQLNQRVNAWLSNPESGFKIDRQNKIVFLSAIFNWYGEDWIPRYGTNEGFTGNEKQRAILNFISNYVSSEDAQYLKAGDYRVEYLDYDWSLNIQ